MPRVPQYQQQVSVQNLPSARVRNSVTPEALGAKGGQAAPLALLQRQVEYTLNLMRERLAGEDKDVAAALLLDDFVRLTHKEFARKHIQEDVV